MVTIRKNEKMNGLEIAFDKKPPEYVLAYLKQNKFRWSGPHKVWYKSYSESLEAQIREYFKDEVKESGPASPEPAGIQRRINLAEYHKAKRGPRKDVIIGEIQMNKMEYAVRKSFDPMTDSSNYHTVTNESFRPAEEAMRTYNNGVTVNFIVEDLQNAIGRTHYIYSAHVEKDEELGHYIVFDDYYIRYKDERNPAEKNIETDNIAFFYRRIPSQPSEIFEESISTIDAAINKAKESRGQIGSFSLLAYYDKDNDKLFIENAGFDNMVNIVLYDFDTEYKLESIKWYNNHENLYAIAERILKPESTSKPAEEPKEDEQHFQPGDRVEVIEKYMTVPAGSTGIVISNKIYDGQEMVSINFGKNLSGQVLINKVPAGYLKVITGTGIEQGDVFKGPTYWYYVYKVQAPLQLIILQVWAYGYEKDLGRFGFIKKDMQNRTWTNDLTKMTVKDLKEFISSLKWYINNTYQEMYGSRESTELQKIKALSHENDEIMMWIAAEIENRVIEEKALESGGESAESKAVSLISGGFVDIIKNEGWEFEYGKMDGDTYYDLVSMTDGEKTKKLQDAGITIIKPSKKEPEKKPDEVSIAKAKAQALILILKLKNKNKETQKPAETEIKSDIPPVKTADDFPDLYYVYADALAERYNYLVSENKSYQILDVYTELTGKHIVSEDYPKFAIDFINEIARGGIKLKKPIELENGVINIHRLPVNPLNKTGIESLSSVLPAKGSDAVRSRPGLAGVFVDNGKLVASDAHRMIIIADESHADNNGNIIDPKTGKQIKEAYPNYKALISSNNDRTGNIPIDALIEISKSASISFRNIEDSNPVLHLVFDDMETGADPDFLLDVLQILKANGANSVIVEYSAPMRALMFRSNNDNLALLMPKTIPDSLGNVLISEKVVMKSLENKPAEKSMEVIMPVVTQLENKPMTFDEFKSNRPKEIIVEYVGGRKNEFVTYTYKYNKYTDRSGWYNRSRSRHISEQEAYEQYLYNLKNSRQVVEYENGGIIQNGPTLFDSDQEVMQFREGGSLSVSQEFMGFYQRLKAANKKNLRTFAESIGAINEHSAPIINYLMRKNVPLIVISHEELKKKIIFKLTPPPESAIFYAQYLKFKGHDKEIVNIFMSVMKNSMLGLGSWAIDLGISLKEAIENTFIHECMHAYLMKEGFLYNFTFSSKLDAIRYEMNDYVQANKDKFTKIELAANRIISHPKSAPDEIIAYTFTMPKIANLLRKTPLKTGKTAWQELIRQVGDNDKNGILVQYVSKQEDVPPLALAIAKAKYKIYMAETETIHLAEGGRVVGPSHEEGGVGFIVKQTGQEVELEGNEAVIKKKVVLSRRKYDFEGKKATPQSILNKLNTDGGGNPI